MDGFKPQFSGHETFPLRYGWLKKAYDAVRDAQKDNETCKSAFHSEDAIATFGVGKNMVTAIRHWAVTCRIIEDSNERPGTYKTSALGDLLFDDEKGVDPYLESQAALWLIHWQLAGTPEKTTTWYWVFNHYPKRDFDREHLSDGLLKLCQHLNLTRTASMTIKRDVECFIRTYVGKVGSDRVIHEDNLECPLTELGLIKPLGKRDGFQTARGPKSSLPNGIFVAALLQFWKRFTSARTLSFETVMYEPGSPGRVFLLDENDLLERLAKISEVTSDLVQWSETAGLRQLFIQRHMSDEELLLLIHDDFCSPLIRRDK